MNKALFLDRDGVINIDHGYVHQADNFSFVPGIFELCQRFQSAGYKVIVVTNQSGIGRGYYTEQDFLTLSEWMKAQFAQQRVFINDVYYCPYHPTHGVGQYLQDSDQRKPNPGMLFKAAQEHDLALSECYLVGDNQTDMHAAQAAGVPHRFWFTDKKLTSTQLAEADANHWQRVNNLNEIAPES